MGRLLFCLALVGFASPAVACLNDTELPSHEREFREEYRAPDAPPWNPPADSQGTGHWLLVYGGAILLTGAFTVAIRARKD